MESIETSSTSESKSPVVGFFLVGLLSLALGAAAVYFGQDVILPEKNPNPTITEGLIRECTSAVETDLISDDLKDWYVIAKTENYLLVVDEKPQVDNEQDPCEISYQGQVYLYNISSKRNYSLEGEVQLSTPLHMEEIGENYLVLENIGIEASDLYSISLLKQTIIKADVLKAPYHEQGGNILMQNDDSILFEKRSGPSRPWGEGDINASSVSALNLETMTVNDLSAADELHDYHLLWYSSDGEQVYVEEVVVKDKSDWDNYVETAEFNVLAIDIN